jgi:membrane protease YdiL (CAAX protease family)
VQQPIPSCESQAAPGQRRFDKKSVGWFLLVTFGITWGVEGVLLARGVSFKRIPPILLQYAVAALMWAPAIGAVFTRRVIRRESLRVPEARVRLGVLAPYAVVMVVMPILFALVYGLTVLLGLGHLDLSLKTFLAQIEAVAGHSLGPQPPARLVIAAIVLGSVIVAPFINSVFAFGEEYGWRGFLLPQLLPLGRWPAHLIGGVIWGLWHAPLVLMGFDYPGFPWAGVVWMCALTTLLGIFESEWTLRFNSVFLASFIHGTFNSQVYGIWRVIVPDAQPLLGGFGGLIGLGAVAVLAALAWRHRVTLVQAGCDSSADVRSNPLS